MNRDNSSEDLKATVNEDRLNGKVFYLSAGLVLAFALFTIFFNAQATVALDATLDWVASTFGWYYFAIASVYIVFVMFLASSRYGDIKLGPKHSKPEFSMLSWASMLFAAGIGIDLMFFSVAEPIAQYMQPPVGQGQTIDAARQAITLTIFHYGLTGWCMYALLGIALGYFSYRYNLPLTVRSALYPIFGDKINGWIGHLVDVAAILGAIFGLATTCGIGVVQLNYGLSLLFGVQEGLTVQAWLVVFAVTISIISATTGVDKGVKFLAEMNVYFAIGLLLFILLLGNSTFLLNSLVLNIGDYVSRFPSMTLDTFAYHQDSNPQTGQWVKDWTLFFWAWWVAWSPFVGLFLARISRGRTIREFVLGTLIIPLLFTIAWLSIMGNSALYQVIHGNLQFAQEILAKPELGFYKLLSFYPWFSFTAVLAFITGLLFYVTSADSGAIVLGSFCYRLKDVNSDAPNWIRIFWSVVIGVLTIAMMMSNGITTLQKATVIMGLPFSFVMILVMLGLFKSLRLEDYRNQSTSLNAAPVVGNVDILNWKQRLSRVMHHPGRKATVQMLDTICKPALEEVMRELESKGVQATIVFNNMTDEHDHDLYHIDLSVGLHDEQNFIYQIWPQRYHAPEFSRRSKLGNTFYYRLETFLFEGSQGNDLMGYSKEQVINDVLDKYERHLTFLHLNREKTAGKSLSFPDPSDS
ncbi:choline BCCT transporter BetT [Acinetobacter sp. B5B]|uniref:choline BCCT transporter BetT n=1 Tax=Acinetobacter baretiae TaxID=2605383 RepID=UPI0018C20D45|nr:choline BCCT transporter BetT [Acinetobacter baretiae]MBF7683049.1 choline BCCT transporter BetT [Acinetobacter baretiae]MBF7684299.1 choline BCCT transporter BetT [Acinetobacter baretiae]